MKMDPGVKMVPLFQPEFGPEELSNIAVVLESRLVAGGVFLDSFVESFRRYLGVEYAVPMSCGTAALHLSLLVLDLKPGDEVILPALTFIAPANAVTYVGGRPVFVDVERISWNMDPDKIEEKITKRTRGILAVHLYGHPANMQAIRKIAQKYGLWILEDATEALGATCEGQRVGTIGVLSCFSFNASKLITTCGGGMVATGVKEYANRVAFLANQGKAEGDEYYHPEIGYNYRLSNFQAAIGVAQMARIESYIEKKRAIAATYEENLRAVSGIEFLGDVPWGKSTFWLNCILVNKNYGRSRQELQEELKRRGIECRPVFVPLHRQPPYRRDESHPVAEDLHSRGLCLPASVSLGLDVVERVAGIIGDFRRV